MPDLFPHRPVTGTVLKFLAALVWYTGGVVLILKGGSLLLEAEGLKPGQAWPWLGGLVGIAVGALKAGTLFVRSCRKNLVRIDNLVRPRLWEFFRPRFFLFLMIMMASGAGLSNLAQGNYAFLIAVAALDLSISVALLGSSRAFWEPLRLQSEGGGKKR